MGRSRIAITARGHVQGVGFRPLVWRLATARGLTGAVWNHPGGASLEVQGDEAAIEDLVAALRDAPAPVQVTALERRTLPVVEERGFTLRDSALDGCPTPCLPPDLAMCAACAAEVLDPCNRRYNYAFTSCTACGPRYSIAERGPFDRERTVMRRFPLCAACQAEYADPADRRYHAQAMACSDCGPQAIWRSPDTTAVTTGYTAILLAADALRTGRIVGMKGLGGYQLLCDAQSETAAARLRARKARPDKPLAVLFPSLDAVERVAFVFEQDRELLSGPIAPIVLLELVDLDALAPSVLRGLTSIGAMLPTTPLHLLLATAFGGPLVCTSGNRSGDPLAIELDQAHAALGHVIDGWLDHDRPILRPVDDSLIQHDRTGRTLLRRARGLAPTLRSVGPGATVLALGAHMKSTVTLLRGDQAITSPYLGELGTEAGLGRLEQTAQDMLLYHGVTPELIACDLHPDYGSTRLAETLAARYGAPLLRVQHHHAHAVAVLAEHGHEAPALALCWDGAGHGEDGAIWGGELLCCDATSSRRLATLRGFPLIGGDRASREPVRVAFAMLRLLQLDDSQPRLAESLGASRLRPLGAAMDAGLNCPTSHGVGRLFDAVSFLLGGPGRCTWEAQAALRLEQMASSCGRLGFTPDPLPLPLVWRDGLWQGDWGPLIAALVARSARQAPEVLARLFHEALADFAAASVLQCNMGLSTVALAGGCFQNPLLRHLVQTRLQAADFTVLAARDLPPNDEAISLGQAVVARATHRGQALDPFGSGSRSISSS